MFDPSLQGFPMHLYNYSCWIVVKRQTEKESKISKTIIITVVLVQSFCTIFFINCIPIEKRLFQVLYFKRYTELTVLLHRPRIPDSQSSWQQVSSRDLYLLEFR